MRCNSLIISTILIIFLLLCNTAIGGESDHQNKLYYFKETSKRFIGTNKIEHAPFSPVEDSLILEKGSYWLRFEVKNTTENDYILISTDIKAKGLVIYRPFRNSLETFGKGYHKQLFKKKEFEYGKSWKVYLEPETSETFYIYVIEPEIQYIHSGSIQISVDKNRLSIPKELIFVAFEQAIFLIIILISLFALFIYHEKTYLYFVFYLIFHDLLFLSGYDFFGNYLFRGNINLNFQARTFYPAGIYFYMLFLFNALDLKKVFNKLYNPYIKTFVVVFSISMLFFTLMSIIDFSFYSNNIVIGSFFFAVCVFFLILAGIPYYYNYGRIFALGAIIFMVSACIRVYQVDFVHSTYHLPYELGVLIDSLIFIYALNLRTKHLLIEKKQAELVKEKLEEQIKNTNRELISNSFSLLKKNAVYKDLSSKVESLSEDEHLDAAKLKKLISSFDVKKQDEKYWKEFNILFDIVHDGFLKRLSTAYPDLTNGELRICGLLRMSMTTKEIANLTNRTERSIEVMRSRIRKKMELPKEQNLTKFLVKF